MSKPCISASITMTFVESVIRLCHNLNKAVCVEGVETKEGWETISLLNADLVQGFYISRPVEPEVFYRKYLTSTYDSRSLVSPIDKEKNPEKAGK